MDKRDLWVVDVETTGLKTSIHVPLEIAAVNVRTGECLAFVPNVRLQDFTAAEAEAMAINRYFERRVWAERLRWNQTVDAYAMLFEALRGNTFGGANPRFDAAMLMRGYEIAVDNAADEDDWYGGEEPWHHRLEDVQSYAAAVMRLPLGDVPSLAAVCAFVDVTNTEEHSALGDARATAECFRRLRVLQLETASQTADKEPANA